jgi:ubiquinone/menaquinone biosynthesis C-methylase UbiE
MALQPDQRPERWDDHVSLYECVFEPLTDAFTAAAIEMLGPLAGKRVIDIGAGAGGAALLLTAAGADVLAVDASPRMVARIAERAAARTTRVEARVMDGEALQLPDASFDAGLSVFGIILFPDAARGFAELNRVLRPGAPAAIVAWTEPEAYELVARLRAAIEAVRGTLPAPSEAPAQLRFVDPAVFRRALEGAGFTVERIERVARPLEAPSASTLRNRIAFAPGIAALLEGLGPDRPAVLDRFVADLERDQGKGPVALGAVAQIALASARSRNVVRS